jgi:hypothetical protein
MTFVRGTAEQSHVFQVKMEREYKRQNKIQNASDRRQVMKTLS